MIFNVYHLRSREYKILDCTKKPLSDGYNSRIKKLKILQKWYRGIILINKLNNMKRVSSRYIITHAAKVVDAKRELQKFVEKFKNV